MNRMKRCLAFFLAVVLVASMTGCVSKEPEKSSTPSASEGTSSSTSTDSSAVTEPTGEAEIDPFGKYDPPITLTAVRSVNAETSIFQDGDDIENNPYTRLLYEELGITVKYDWVVDANQAQAKFATMLASNALPDYFRANSADFMNLAQNDAVMDITELYDTWASDLLKTHDSNFKEGYDSGFVNGKHYGIADLGWGIISMPNIMWIRQDWLAESGMEAPKTLDEFEALAKKFQENHPGSVVALEKSLLSGVNSLTPIMNAYGAYPGIWVEADDGTLVCGDIQPEVKTALERIQKMYADGIFDKEFSVKDTNKVTEDTTAGKVGITLACNNIGFWAVYDLAKNDPDAAFIPFDIPKLNADDDVYLQGGWPVGEYIVINKNMEHPEAVIKMINVFCKHFAAGTFDEPEYKGTSYWTWPSATQCDPTNEYVSYKNISEALVTGDDSKITAQQRPFYTAAKMWQDEKDTVTDNSAYGRYVQMGPNGAYSVIAPYVDNDRILLDRMQGAVPPNYAKVSETLKKLRDDTYTKIIMGAPIDEFDKFVEDWKKLGGDDATVEVNEWYGK